MAAPLSSDPPARARNPYAPLELPSLGGQPALVAGVAGRPSAARATAQAIRQVLLLPRESVMPALRILPMQEGPGQ